MRSCKAGPKRKKRQKLSTTGFSRNIRYVSLSFGVGRFQPHAAAEVLQNRYGDCKDKATCSKPSSMERGFTPAHPYHSRMDVDPAVPSPLQFDHAITFLALDGHDTWLDSTLQVAPFGYLLPQLRGKEALVVTTDVPAEPEKIHDHALTKRTLRKANIRTVRLAGSSRAMCHGHRAQGR